MRRGEADLGDTPVVLPIPAGEQWALSVSLDGYETRTVTVLAGQPRAHVRLTPAPAAAAPAAPAAIRPRPRPAPAVVQPAPVPQPVQPAWASPRSSDNRDPWGN